MKLVKLSLTAFCFSVTIVFFTSSVNAAPVPFTRGTDTFFYITLFVEFLALLDVAMMCGPLGAAFVSFGGFSCLFGLLATFCGLMVFILKGVNIIEGTPVIMGLSELFENVGVKHFDEFNDLTCGIFDFKVKLYGINVANQSHLTCLGFTTGSDLFLPKGTTTEICISDYAKEKLSKFGTKTSWKDIRKITLKLKGSKVKNTTRNPLRFVKYFVEVFNEDSEILITELKRVAGILSSEAWKNATQGTMEEKFSIYSSKEEGKLLYRFGFNK
ncbi:uncharacterized protein NDAI_0H01250 [Naumovozyma dairenensis CBS 421]|uniref:Uncharacterized protein n=1 Tax=Naumovozyma dairenensis (strain ATCC 10597 / BCRC 20456 / CBS 421 / NBRC 0211 / NRRL Y-12639) TaxID=1071378 RepID=G0WET8_NAUDC|nr:hypothetical protein NDAI_0H01250 [Naumovozyma dairenensis CBS 421]CCD26299.1 hypothetical protein NDAI_0H01250 [Naumovozyma dairenensis CBS 421]